MIKRFLPLFAVALLFGNPAFATEAETTTADPVQAQAQVGQPAPDFTATDIEGNPVSLSDFEGKTVVLEWTNHDCPFVVKHYSSGNMQSTQKAAMEEFDAAWITIVSSAPGKQGHVSPEQAKAIMDEAGAQANAKILDESGEIGKKYGAMTTPHMYVIDPQGTLVYAGAIDSIPTADKADIEAAENYVIAALESLEAGEPVATPESKPYGCAVKY